MKKIASERNDARQTSSNDKKEIIINSFSWVLLLKCRALFLQGFFMSLWVQPKAFFPARI
jgi:hypothetical protein